MSNITNHENKYLLLKVSFLFLSFFLFLNLSAQNGKELFTANCTACHFANSTKLVGPGLAGITGKRKRKWLIDWVKDSQKMVKAGDADAVAIFDEYKIPMTAYASTLSDKEIGAIFDYLANPAGTTAAKSDATTTEKGSADGASITKGKELFTANCTACHFANSTKLVGPGLAGITDKRKRKWLIDWVKDSQKMVKAGDADAVAIFDEYKIPMTSYASTLSDKEIGDIFDYLANPAGATPVKAAAEKGSSDGGLAAKGEKIFKTNCSACHSVGANKVVGPGLKGIADKRSEEWIIKWVTNSTKFIASGDADANAIFDEFNKMPMPPQALSPDEIKAVLAYIKNPTVKKAGAKEEKVAATPVKQEGSSFLTTIILIAVILVLFILLFIFNKSRVAAAKKVAADKGEVYDGPETLLQGLMYLIRNNKGLVALLIIVLIFAGLVELMAGAFEIGVDQGYKPEQPIKFSHKIHAGLDKIDCNYCHSGARHSKTSGIPSLNVCMNCHKFINGTDGKTFEYDGKEYPMPEEINKIYKHLDYNPKTGEYGNHPTPVRWIKVHNLPDFVFFSHQQHVVVGKQKCQTCHGDVQNMEVVKQYSLLTMKWCIDCHQKTQVATKGNGYYEDMHSRMTPAFKAKVFKDGKLTVNEIGGWECAKCHY